MSKPTHWCVSVLMLLCISSLYGQTSVPPPSPPPELEEEFNRDEAVEKARRDAAEHRRRLMSQRVEKTEEVRPKPKKEKKPKPAPKKPIPWCLAATLVAAYSENEVKADLIYKGEIIGVVGIVDSVSRGAISDIIHVNLRVFKTFRQVSCSFSEAEIASVVDLKPGQPIKIYGKCAGLLVNVHLTDCKVLD